MGLGVTPLRRRISNASLTLGDLPGVVWASDKILGIPADVFGAWGQWLGAVATFLAVFVALWVAISDARRRAAEQEDRQAAQARTITARAAFVRAQSTSPMQVKLPPAQRLAVIVENHGMHPITDVHIDAVTLKSDVDKRKKWRLLNGTHVIRAGGDDEPWLLSPVIAPSGHATSPTLEFVDAPDVKLDAHNIEVTFSFVDAEGYRWWRSGNRPPGRVTEIEFVAREGKVRSSVYRWQPKLQDTAKYTNRRFRAEMARRPRRRRRSDRPSKTGFVGSAPLRLTQVDQAQPDET